MRCPPEEQLRAPGTAEHVPVQSIEEDQDGVLGRRLNGVCLRLRDGALCGVAPTDQAARPCSLVGTGEFAMV